MLKKQVFIYYFFAMSKKNRIFTKKNWLYEEINVFVMCIRIINS